VNSKNIEYDSIKLIYENVKLMYDNIDTRLENETLMKRLEKAMEFDELVNKVCGAKDAATWRKKSLELESLLKKVLPFCPSGYKNEIWNALKEMR
jgi:hypothetical protein